QYCVPQRQLVVYSSEHDGLDPFLPKGSRPSSRQTTTSSAIATPRLFQVEVATSSQRLSWRPPSSPVLFSRPPSWPVLSWRRPSWQVPSWPACRHRNRHRRGGP